MFNTTKYGICVFNTKYESSRAIYEVLFFKTIFVLDQHGQNTNIFSLKYGSPYPVGTRRICDVATTSQIRCKICRSDVTEFVVMLHPHDVTGRRIYDESTTNCDVAATSPFRRRFVAKTSQFRCRFVVVTSQLHPYDVAATS